MMNYFINTIPHEEQRYPTVGDYYDKAGVPHIYVSDMGNETYELAVALHELIERHLCVLAGVDLQSIDDFDIEYEEYRQKGLPSARCGCKIADEPGMDIHAPYHTAHVFATKLERQFVDEASWITYDRVVESL